MTDITQVLQLEGSLSASAATVETHLNESLFLLEESKNRKKQVGGATIAAAAFYIKVIVDINKHVTKHLGAAGDANNDGSINADNVDDAYSLSAMQMLSGHFSDTATGTAGSKKYAMKALEGGAAPQAGDDDYWRTSAGAEAHYKLPTPNAAVSLKMGHITFEDGSNNAARGFAVNVSIDIQDATENSYSVSAASVSGNNLSANIDDVITSAQYAYVSKSNLAGQAAMTDANKVLDGNFGADSKRQADGSDQLWITTSDDNVDNLEDKLSVEVEATEVQAAYAAELTALRNSLLTNNKVLTSWQIDLNAIGADTDSLLSRFGRHAEFNAVVTNSGASLGNNIFAAGDKIVVTDNALNNKKVTISFGAKELKATGLPKDNATEIVGGDLFALIEQS